MNDLNRAAGSTGQMDAAPEMARHLRRQPSRSRRLRWATFLLSGAFLLLSALFLLAPAAAAGFYGLDAGAPSALFYLRAIGLRDAALALYLFGLAGAKQWRALSIVALATSIIPAGDILLLAASGAGEPVHYLLHAGSLICFTLLAWGCRAQDRQPSRNGW